MNSRGQNSIYWATLAILILLFLVPWVPGFGGASTGLRQSRISGRVTFNDKPLTEGTIIFMPSDRRGSDWAAATLDGEGKFRLEDNPGNETLSPGKYQIFFVFKDKIEAETKLLRETPETTAKPAQPNVEPANELWPIPTKYTRPESSGLSVTLGREPNKIVISLKG